MKRGWSNKEFSYWDMDSMKHKIGLMQKTIAVEADKKRQESQEYPIALMIKLGWDQVKKDNAYATVSAYEEIINTRGESWFGSNALASGVGKKRRQELITAIENKRKVHMYFIISKTGGGTNEIEYQADVLGIESKKGGVASPESELTPEVYRHQKCSIWIKLANLRACSAESVADFKFVSNDKKLKQALNGTCSFGYITRLHSEF